MSRPSTGREAVPVGSVPRKLPATRLPVAPGPVRCTPERTSCSERPRTTLPAEETTSPDRVLAAPAHLDHQGRRRSRRRRRWAAPPAACSRRRSCRRPRAWAGGSPAVMRTHAVGAPSPARRRPPGPGRAVPSAVRSAARRVQSPSAVAQTPSPGAASGASPADVTTTSPGAAAADGRSPRRPGERQCRCQGQGQGGRQQERAAGRDGPEEHGERRYGSAACRAARPACCPSGVLPARRPQRRPSAVGRAAGVTPGWLQGADRPAEDPDVAETGVPAGRGRRPLRTRTRRARDPPTARPPMRLVLCLGRRLRGSPALPRRPRCWPAGRSCWRRTCAPRCRRRPPRWPSTWW